MGFYMIWIDSGHIWNHYNLKIIITYSNLYMNSEPCWRTWMDMVLAFLRQEFIIVHHFSILFFNCIMIQFKPGCLTTKRLPDVRCYCSLGHLKICDWLFSGTTCLPSSGESRLLACFRYVQNSLCGPHWMWGHRRIPVNPRLRLDDFSQGFPKRQSTTGSLPVLRMENGHQLIRFSMLET